MASASSLGFPPAAQPDIVRAAQKDDTYATLVAERFSDACARAAGPRFCVRYAGVIRAVGRALYPALTSLAGTRTLGEEYCDLTCRDAGGGAPGARARWTRFLVSAFGEEVVRALRGRVVRNVERGVTLEEGAPRSARAADAAARTALALAGERIERGDGRSTSEELSHGAQMIDARGGFANAAHVALFYAYGEYYEWSCRAAGVRRAFTGAYAGEERPSYAVLGAFVAFQLAVVAFENASALARAGRASSESRASSSATRESTSPCYEADGTRAADAPIERDVAIIERDVFGRVVGDTDRPSSSTVSPLVDAKCALCLSSRRAPAATPCGHVFCWRCIAGWTSKKPECPLCRAPSSPQTLVPLSNFA